MRALQYAFDEAISSLWRGRTSGVLSTATIAVALFVLGSSSKSHTPSIAGAIASSFTAFFTCASVKLPFASSRPTRSRLRAFVVSAYSRN